MREPINENSPRYLSQLESVTQNFVPLVLKT